MAGFFVIFAVMKRVLRLLSVIVMLAACHRPTVETMCTSSLQPNLTAIDTLMQSQPDSALTLLLDEQTNEPYYQLLLSEALYKNDYAQANRAELLEAMAYFDSIHCPFLSARAHYMNGVGNYEMDSVVAACEEYMKAIQIMEEHYPEKELVGLKAKYLALAYTKLTVLFSNQYLHEQAIYFGKQALHYYYKYEAEPWHVAWVLNKIGTHYDAMEQVDSASFYYDNAMAVLPDSTGLNYRDISAAKAFLSYRMGKDAATVMEKLKKLYHDSESERERLSRGLMIGEVYYHENNVDSASYYFSMVYDSQDNDQISQILAAQRLQEVFSAENDSLLTNKYTVYLSQQATTGDTKATLHSNLTTLYSGFLINKHDYSNSQVKRAANSFVFVMGIILFLVLLSIAFTRFLWKKQHDKKTFLKEPICQHILDIVNNTAFKAKIDCKIYADKALGKEQLLALRLAADQHYHGFDRKLRSRYPGLTDNDLNHCCLLLLGLEEAAISGLLQKSYTAVCDRNRKLKKVLSIKEDLFDEIRNI